MDESSNYGRRYSYSPLDPTAKEIRLLYLDECPSDDSSVPVRCQMRHVSLLEEPTYYAVSYSWGEEAGLKAIYLNGVLSDVPGSAERALRGTYSTSEGHKIPVWIDALCIDQDDLTEKSHQVAIMGEVYSSASEVRVWLGEQAGTTEAAIRAIDTLIDLYSEEPRQARSKAPKKGFTIESAHAALDVNWEAVHMFLDAQWFTRLWPVQEVVLAKYVLLMCGTCIVSWTQLAQFVKLLSKHRLSALSEAIYFDGGRGALNVGGVDQIRRGERSGGEERSLQTLLVRTLGFKATDPRDKIFALFGFLGKDSVSQDIRTRLMPNYHIAKKDLYIRATSLAMETSTKERVRLLRYAQILEPTERLVLDHESGSLVDNEGFPSWVPRYDLVRSNLSGSPSMTRHQGRGADLSLPDYVTFQTGNNDLLCAKGVRFSTIAATTTLPDTTSELWSMLPFTDEQMIVSSLRSLWNARDDICCTTELVDELADTFTMGYINHSILSWAPPDYKALIQRDAHAKRGQAVEDLARLFIKESILDRDQKTYLRSTHNQVINRAPFLDSNHKTGLGQLWQKSGDIVCIMFGCSVPLILRPKGSHWRLIGDAYVRGIMKGEHIEMLQREGRLEAETEVFTIH